jgi:hypothetical protein
MSIASKKWLRTYAAPIAVLVALGVIGGTTASLIDAHSIQTDFYLAIATTVPILLLAVAVRIGSLGEETTRDERQSLVAAMDVVRLAREAPADDEELTARLNRLREGLMPVKLEGSEVAMRIVFAFAFFYAAMSECGCLYVLASRNSTIASFFMASAGGVGLFVMLFVMEETRVRGQRTLRRRRIEALSEGGSGAPPNVGGGLAGATSAGETAGRGAPRSPSSRWT